MQNWILAKISTYTVLTLNSSLLYTAIKPWKVFRITKKNNISFSDCTSNFYVGEESFPEKGNAWERRKNG